MSDGVPPGGVLKVRKVFEAETLSLDFGLLEVWTSRLVI
jgi:hypothetical protein